MKTFKEAYGRRHDAYTRDYHSSIAGMGKHQSAAYHADGGANDEGWDREPHHKPADHPHSVHINGKKWKTFGSHSHASNVAKKIKGATVHKEETACPVCKKDPCECEDSHGFVQEARLSAAARLQLAFQREQEKSAASRKRAHELLNPPKKEEPKPPVKEELSDPTRNAKQEKDIATGKKPMPKRKLLGFKQKTC